MSVWKQRLTVENLEEVGERLRGLLEDKEYVFVASQEGRLPVVRIGLRLDPSRSYPKGMPVQTLRVGCYGFIKVAENNTKGWTLGTGPAHREDDEPYETPEVTFHSDRVAISFRTDSGFVSHWVLVVTGDIPVGEKK